MVNLNEDYRMHAYDHTVQEENLCQLFMQYPHEKNLKIFLTYEKALLELNALSKMPEYEQYFHSMLHLVPAEACPKVLGVWFDKVAGFIRVALLDGKNPEFQWNSGKNLITDKDISGKVIGLSLKDPFPEWKKIADFSWGCCNLFTPNEYALTFHGDNYGVGLYIFFPKEGKPYNPPDMIPENAISSFVVEYPSSNRGKREDHYHIIKKVDLNRIYDIGQLGDESKNREGYSCFYIHYKNVEMAVNPPKQVKSARSSLQQD